MKRQIKRIKRKSTSLSIVQFWCPWVQTVGDADKPMFVIVTQHDVNHAEVKSHNTCALAIACKRKFHADSAIISPTVAYIVKGITATRYHLGPSIQKEITVFDRKGPFYAGKYQLSPPSPSNRLGLQRSYDPVRKAKGGNRTTRFMHYTEGVRTALSRLPAEKIMKKEIAKMKKQLK